MKNLLNIRFLILYFFLLLSMNLFAQELLDNDFVHQINFSGAAEDYIIPADVTYDRIEFFLDGGDGGKGSYCNIKGGKGAHVKAVFKIGPLPDELRPGGTVRFIVGKRGDNRTVETAAGGAGGGGGTAILYKNPGATTDDTPSTNLFEADTNWVILAVAGAGGGAFQRRSNPGNQCGSNSKRGQGGQTGTSGGGDGINTGGTNGNGGKANNNGGAGGGYLTGGMNQSGQHSNDDGDTGGVSGGNGGVLGIDGGWGYGGGGTGAFENEGGGGGGGGFSGGGGGVEGNRRGFGGGSFVNDADLDAFRSLDGNHTVSTPKNGYITYKFFNESGVIAKCKNVTVQLDASGQQTFLPSEANDGSYTTDGSTIIGYSASAVATPGLLASFDFDCTDLGDHEFILAVLPNTGSPRFCSFNLSVVDASMPVALCKNATINLNGSGSSLLFPADIDDGSFDGCSSTILFLDKEEFDCSDIGGNTVELTVQDEEDNTGTCTASVTVRDIAAPMLTGSSLIPPIQLDASGVASITPNQIILIASDNCGNPSLSLSQSSFTCNDLGQNTVTVTATDGSGNTSSLEAIVNVVDNVAPQAVCQNTTVFLDDSENTSLSAIEVDGGSTDNCGIQSRTLNQSNFDCNDVGTVVVELTVTDQGGNTNTCTANVLVEDNSLPTALCQDATIAVNDQGQANFTAADIDDGSSQHCGQINLSVSPLVFDCSSLGDNLVTLTVTDQNGTQSICTATVTVVDDTPPVALCKDLTINLGSNGIANRYRGAFNDGSYDNCGSITVLNNLFPIAFDCNSIGASTITMTVSDDSNFTSSCTATATVVDNESPIATCWPATVQLNGDGAGTLSPGQVLFISNDACGIQSRTVSPAAFDCDDIGDQPVVVTVTDNNGNSSTCSAIVTIEDNIPPVALCKNLTINVGSTGIQPRNRSDFNDGSYDNCGSVTVLNNTPSIIFSCQDIGTSTITVSVSDGNLTSSCTATATIVDITPPIAICKTATVQLDANGTGNLTPGQVLIISNDPCGIQSRTVNPSSFDCTDIGTQEVTVTVTDNSGNSNTCSRTVTITDDLPPVALCQNATLALDDEGQAMLLTTEVVNGSFHPCQSINTMVNPTDFDCDDIGNHEVTLTVSAENNEQSTCTAVVTVIDDVSATAICNDVTVSLNEQGQASLSVTDVDGGSFDNCEAFITLYAATSYDCSDIGENIGFLSVYDNNAPGTSCLAVITVVDEIPPVPVCLNSVVTFSGELAIEVSPDQLWDEAASSDNCLIDSEAFEIPSVNISCDQIGSIIPITVTISDLYGNTSECIANITVEGLPCGFQSDQINCTESTQAGYDPTTGTYNLSAENCYDPNYYSNSDVQNMIQQELCGDGEIIAHVVDIDGDAWAGIFMRESNNPGAKTLQLAINNSGLAQRKLRTTTGGYAFNHLFQNQGKYWLRLTRSGSQFGAFLSLDGINWDPVLMTNIPMTNCIQTGLFLSNTTTGSSATAWYDQVQIKPPAGNGALQTPNFQFPISNSEIQPDFSVYPNPTDGEVHIVLDDFMEQSVQIKVYNQQGQMVKSVALSANHSQTERLKLYNLKDGLYLVQLRSERQSISKKISLIR